MGKLTSGLLLVLTIVVAVFFGLNRLTQPQIPAHMLGNPSEFIHGLLTEEQSDRLLTLAKQLQDFPINLSDLKFYKTKHEHVGEAQPISKDGTCDHPYLVPSVNGTLCILPGRIDVGRHYILTGGVQGFKEPYEDQVARLLSFGRYQFGELDKHEIVSELFHADKFKEAAKAVCPPHKQVLDPFQFNFIAQVPGQTVALHIDGTYFWGATRFQFPQWLLAAMEFSGLYQDRFIDQIQVVSYFHKWAPSPERGGEFVYWDTNEPKPKSVPPLSLAGSIVDGSKTLHAATVYYPSRKAPKLDKSAETLLKYIGDDKWDVISNGTTVQTFNTDDLRWTVVYRARCFASQEEVEKFNNFPPEEELELEDVLNTLKNELVRRGRLSSDKKLDRLDLALTLLDEYVRYPLPSESWIPYNYCALMRLYPSLSPLFSLICN